MFRAVACGASIIAIIDGFFETRAPVRHKEILWALSAGVPVYGAASMGALRAAELDRYGMLGVGHIYEDFRCGELERDDEVAVVHGPAELGFPAVSEALVNIRATVRRALAARTISEDDAASVLCAAQGLFFKERTWAQVIGALVAAGMERCRAEPLVRRLEDDAVDSKRADALALLQLLENLTGRGLRPLPPAVMPPPETPALRAARARAFTPEGRRP